MNLEGLSELIQFGFAGIALWMLYSISYNHLKNIENTLIEIKELLRAKL